MDVNIDKTVSISRQEQTLHIKTILKPLSLQCLQLALISLTIHVFKIEVHLGLPELMVFVFAAFIINALLPQNYKLPFFFFASLGPIFYFFGWLDAILLITFALLMIGTCHLPISLLLRKIGVLALGAMLAYVKLTVKESGGGLLGSFSSQIVSVLGTMFMFRMILYLYELKYEKDSVSIWQRLTYFFMLPNVCFPIFPIVDYKVFKRTYYDQPDITIYQNGLNLMVMGLVQLLIYRVLYYITPNFAEVTGFWTLLKYIFLSYLMLIRLNGILNIAVGILRLFGFNLPEIFNYMFLARGFADYWRRLNIYWKDFLVKIVYYPIYFKLRKKGTNFALIIGTTALFIFNWFFHTYQWFWVLGKFPVRASELLTWICLGSLVLLSILKDQRQPEPASSQERNKWLVGMRASALWLFTFLVISFIYSLYISPSLMVFSENLSKIMTGTVVDWSLFLSGTAIMLAFGSYLFVKIDEGRFQKYATVFQRQNRFPLFNSLILGGILLSTTPWAKLQVEKISGYSMQPFINHHLNLHDQRKQFDGYYEEMMFADNFSSPLWQMEYQKPSDWENINELGILVNKNGVTSLEPNASITFKDAQLRTNKWGQRDKDYEKVPPPNMLRFAIVGGSAEMGAGVSNEAVFEQLAEQKLNANFAADTSGFEIINFAVSGMSVIRNIEKIRQEVFAFQPKHMLMFVHKMEERHVLKSLRWLETRYGNNALPDSLRLNIPWFAELKAEIKKENIQYDANLSNEALEENGWKVLHWGYRYIKEQCDKNNVEMHLVFLPDIFHSPGQPYLPFEELAAKNDINFINLSGIFQAYKTEELQISVWDNHPNELGHRLIADKLYEELINLLELE